MTEPRRRLNLSPDERRELAQLAARSGRSGGLRRRAYAILLLSRGLKGLEITRRTGYTGVHVSRLKARFLAARLVGLADRPRPGRPPRAPLNAARRVVAEALRAAVAGTSCPAIPDIAKRTGVSLHRVREVLSEHGLAQPAGRRSRLKPLRVDGIAGVCLRPRDLAFVLSANLVRPRPSDEALSEFVHVLGAVAGGLCSPDERKDDPRADVFRFLDTLAGDCDGELHAILGGRSQYERRAIEECEAVHPRVRLHFTPRGARWEDMVGEWLNLLPKQVTRWETCRSVPRLVRALRDHLIAGTWPPFIWTSGPRGGPEPRGC
jgi:transposase